MKRTQELEKLRKSAKGIVQKLAAIGYSAAMLILDDSANCVSTALNVYQPASGLGAVVTEPDFADYIKEGLSTYKSDGMVP